VGSRVFAVVEAHLVDLSTGGALLEHVEPVRPGAACEVMIEGGGEGLRLKCHVVRSVLTRREGPGSDRPVCYHTGVEFQNLTPPQTSFLEAMLNKHSGDGRGKLLTGLSVLLFWA
jgi:hypothetical protein